MELDFAGHVLFNGILPNTMYLCLVMVSPEIYWLPLSYLERSDFDLLFDKSGSYLRILKELFRGRDISELFTFLPYN